LFGKTEVVETKKRRNEERERGERVEEFGIRNGEFVIINLSPEGRLKILKWVDNIVWEDGSRRTESRSKK
jgi:hypothetical protein